MTGGGVMQRQMLGCGAREPTAGGEWDNVRKLDQRRFLRN
jgi:hypothetical protein